MAEICNASKPQARPVSAIQNKPVINVNGRVSPAK
jgi:hypothetical protein